MIDQPETLQTFLARHKPGKNHGYRLRDIRALGPWVLLLTDGAIATFDSRRGLRMVDHKSGYQGHWLSFPATGEVLDKIGSVEEVGDWVREWIVEVSSSDGRSSWRWRIFGNGALEEVLGESDGDDDVATLRRERDETRVEVNRLSSKVAALIRQRAEARADAEWLRRGLMRVVEDP